MKYIVETADLADAPEIKRIEAISNYGDKFEIQRNATFFNVTRIEKVKDLEVPK